MKMLLALIVSFSVSFAQAAGSFKSLADALSNHKIQVTEQVVDLNAMTPEQAKQFQVLAQSASNLWSDTILEGDYMASNEAVTVDEVVALYQGSKLIAYKMVYSLKSWDTSTCELDYEALGNDDANLEVLLKECSLGRIFDQAFVTPNLKHYENDWNQMADFRAN